MSAEQLLGGSEVPFEDLGSLVERSRTDQAIPGIAVAVVAPDGSTELSVSGWIDEQGSRPVGPHTRFSLQSISKLFTALGALAAVRDGLVGLDEPIRSYLPGFTVQSRFGDDPTAQFTLRHLLSHTAGLTHEAPVGNNMLAGEGSFEDHVASISSTWLRYPVGQRYAYSNLGVDLAGHVLAVVSNTPLQERLRHSVLEPLGLGRTTFDWEVVRDDPDAARGHDRRVPDLSFHMPMLAAGGCWSTATDLTRFLGHALAGFDGFLPPELIEELYRVPGRLPGQQGGYSLGVVTFSHAGRVLHAHGGGGCGFLADLYWAPESGVGAAMLSNCTWHSLQFELVSRLIADRAGPVETVSTEPHPAPVADADLGPWTGEYIGRGRTITLEATPHGLNADLGDVRCRAWPSSQDELFLDAPSGPCYLRRMAPEPGQPPYLVDLGAGDALDRNDPPLTGLSASEALGRADYELRIESVPIGRVSTWTDQDGTPRLGPWQGADALRLAPFGPGLYVSSTGEVLDLRSGPVTFASMPLYPVSSL